MDLQPGLNHFRGMRWRLVEGQRERTLGVDLHEALEKGNKMHRQLAIMIGRPPLAAHIHMARMRGKRCKSDSSR